MTNRNPILRPLLGALLAAAILLPASSPAFPGKQGAAPPMGGGGHGKGAPAMGGDPAAKDASKAASEPPAGSVPAPVDPSASVELPDVVAKVDGVEYGAPIFRDYVRDILQKRPRTKEEFFPLLQQFALDVAAAPDVLAANPALGNDVVVLNEVAKVRARVYPRAFFSHEIEGKVKPTDEELLSLAPSFSPVYNVRIISADKYGDGSGEGGLPAAMAKIDAAERALASGTPFEAVAADRKYNDAISSGDGSKVVTLSELNPSPFSSEEFERFRNLKDNQVSPVFPTRLGYAIVRIERIVPVAEQKADDLKRNRGAYLGEFQKREYNRRYEELVSKAKIEWNEPVLEKVRAAVDNNQPLRPFINEVLVRVNGTAVLGRDVSDVSALHGGNVLDIHLEKRVRTEIVGQEVERLGVAGSLAPLLDLARRRALVRRHFDLRREELKTGDAELRDFYEKNKDRFKYEEQRRLVIVETADEKKAKDVAKQGRKGKDFSALAEKYNDHPEARKAKGHAGLVGRKQLPAALAEKVFAAPAGDVIGPLETADRATGKKMWSVVKVVEVLPEEVKPYDSLKREILLDKYLANQMEALNREFLEAANKRHKVELMMTPDGGRGNEEKKG